MTSHDVAVSPQSKAEWPWLKGYPENVDWYRTYKSAPIYVLLDEAASSHPENICTDFLGRKLTYGEISKLVDETAAGLQALGVGAGSRVGLLLPNSPTYIVYYFAILKAGGVVVNYNPLYTVEELSAQVVDSDTEIMVTLDLRILFDKVEALISNGTLKQAVVGSFPGLLPATKAALFKLFKWHDLARPTASPVSDKILLDADVRKPGGKPVLREIDPDKELAVLQYTGGTTGVPKGAMLSHANIYINTLQVSDWGPVLAHGEERFLAVLPFFHVFAMTAVMNVAVKMAASMIIMARFRLNDTLALIHSSKPTVMPGVPTLFNAIINHPKLSSYDLSSLKYCISGGAALPLEVRTRFEELCGCPLVEGYGLSETSPVVTCNPIDGTARSNSIGLPVPATIISLRDVDDPEREVATGEKGELCVKGPQVMMGYWKNPEETEKVFTKDGFLRTGDVARMDEDGRFSIVDRMKDLIICSGFNVYPRRVEDAIYAHPDVVEVTVIGIEDSYRGEAPKAFVKLRDAAEVTEEDLMTFLEPKLSKIEMPSVIEFREELPKTLIGKLSKKELKEEERQRRAAN
ncbi:Long-chain-fatty-acid--CoA ligase [Candidatus Filomicrobium marinum]|uniref:Long-chain-fatty-acid--CoA ligase n=1 Tax=Candidatus Filomicrobium marinum TaxID=1608628 RepID=A0A0D6JIS3_9HYPH|nr:MULTISPECIES: long-chain fatty acid--CoA ligase [Filomicrobium]MCV0369298.1 long-chain fatty acid--CoA ligase [Filomicrobium sp.]CFX39434.1 Long-chain-fatty-acid--CoA ligase [Candidatus Filomicrobium marinum]CPR21406.1 Long-chain-fatty-acid--CoA ligase [Candidatus Filomicrobium marinum]